MATKKTNPAAKRRIAQLAAIEQADAILKTAEDKQIERINEALVRSFAQLKKDLERRWPKYQSGDTFATDRGLLLASELKAVLNVLDPKSKRTKQLKKDFKELLQLSDQNGNELAGQLLSTYTDSRGIAVDSTVSIRTDVLGEVTQEAYDRLLKYGTQFAQESSIIVQQGIIQNWTVSQTATALASRLGLAQSRAEMIVRTETAKGSVRASEKRYAKEGVDLIQVIETQDTRVCQYCAARAGSIYKRGEYEVIKHPNCRGRILPIKEEWIEAGLVDLEWAAKHHADAVTKAGGKNAGPAPFERSAGITPPKPWWKPGQEVKLEPKPVKSGGFPKDLSELTVVKKLGGSTGAELVEDKAGNRFVRKSGSSPEHIREEFLADQMYQAFGVKVPEAKLYETKDGPVKLARFIEGRQLADLDKKEFREATKKVQGNFAVDAFLKNWDVIGLESDNILIDSNGEAWRIDNGASLRYRAQGRLKNESLEYPTELWTMRDRSVNSVSAKVFRGLDYYDVLPQIKNVIDQEKRIIDLAPPDLKDDLRSRFHQMKSIYEIGNTFKDDQWRPKYTDTFTKHTIQLRRDEVHKAMSVEVRQPSKNSVEVYDEYGKKFDALRGRRSVAAEFEKYINQNGGDHDIVDTWKQGQASHSWSDEAKAYKSFLYENRTVKDGVFWLRGKDASDNELKAIADRKTYDETMIAHHAFVRETLERLEFNNKVDGKVRVVRTEDSGILKSYGLGPRAKNKIIPRNVDSTSVYDPITVYGNAPTVMEVPIHRMVGTYFLGRGSVNTGSFLGDGENEFVAMLDGIPLIRKSKAKAKEYLSEDFQEAKKTSVKANAGGFYEKNGIKYYSDMNSYLSAITKAFATGMEFSEFRKLNQLNL